MEEVGNEHIEEPAVVEIVKFINKKLPASPGCEAVYTIYRVPKLLRQANDKGFEPQLLSIGPFHHGKEELKPMEEKKFQYLQAILSRNPMVELKDYVKEIMKLEAQARSCYSENISLKGDFEFENMLLLDGCFLVEMFLRIGTKIKGKQLPQFISQEMWLPHFISHDMLLLENQIPFIILERICSLVVPEQELGSSIKDLALLCFQVVHVMPLNKDAKAKEKYDHLLDLFHHHCLPHDEAGLDVGEQFHPNLEDRLISITAAQEQFHPNLEDRLMCTTPQGQFHLNLEDRLVLKAAEEQFDPDLADGLRLTTVEEQFLPKIECTPELSVGGGRMEARIEPPPVVMIAESRIEQPPVITMAEARIEWQPALRMAEARIEWPPVEEQSVREPLLPRVRRGLCTPLEDMIRTLIRVVRNPREESKGRMEESDEYKRLPSDVPSAEELQDAGIKFKRKEETPGNFLDIEFHENGAVMKIPYLYFSDNLLFIFRNLIAYEQCSPKVGTFFTGYALFMDDLVNTAKDVQILRHSRILEHGSGSDEELAQQFNQLNKGVFYYAETTYLYSQRKKINKYYMNPWNILRANLVREYFYSPWAILSLAGALLALALTIFQTGLSIYSTFYS